MSRPPRAPHSVTALGARFHISRAVGFGLSALRRLASGDLRRMALPEEAPNPGKADTRDSTSRSAPRVLVIDRYLPRPEIDSGSVRMAAILRILSTLGLSPVIISDDFASGADHALDAAVPAPPDIRSAIRWIEKHSETIELAVLSRHTTATHWAPLLRALIPGVKIVFDTVDLHWVREFRQATVAGSGALKALARVTRHRESALLRTADRTWVVSSVEKQMLEREFPGAPVDVVSNIVEPMQDRAPYGARSHFVFLGNFAHAPNVDAVTWLATWWPDIRRALPEAQLHIIGASLPDVVAAGARELDGVRVMGHVKDLEPHLLSARVMLAPLRYGAGVKGKINSAFSAGLPVVATRCAIEGMANGTGASGALVGESRDELIEAAIRLYTDPELWTELSTSGLHVLNERFSTAAATSAIRESLSHLDIPVGA